MQKNPIKRRKLISRICLSILLVFVAMLPMIMQYLSTRLHLTDTLVTPSIGSSARPDQATTSSVNRISPEIVPANSKIPPKIDYENPPLQHPE